MAEAANRRTVMTLFSDPVSIHSHRIRLVLSEKNVTCEIEDVDPTAIPEDLLDLNPYGTVPTLVDRDLALFDTRVMCEYIDERFPHPPLLPVDPVTRANIRQYMSRIESDWYPMAEDILAGGKAAAKARKELKEALTASAPIFAASPFFMSEEYTLVDATLAPLLWRLDVLGIELTGAASKQVLTYAATMFKRAGFIKSLTEGEREMRGKK